MAQGAEPGIARRTDLLARVLEIGLAAVIVLAPLPSGSVREPARSVLEIGAFALGVLWMVRAAIRSTRLPPLLARAGIAGFLLLGALQLLPLGERAVALVSPRAAAIRADSRPPQGAAEGERQLLGGDPERLDRPAALSVDPAATASALRTGAALAMLLFVAVTVAAERGATGIALALLLAAAVQGLYGTLVVAAGAAASGGAAYGQATGTFVNKNHFAGFLAASLPAGLALVLARLRHLRSRDRRLTRFLGGEGSRALLIGLLAVVGLAGLLLSFSRAGIALGALAIVLTFAAAGRRAIGARLAVAIVVLAVAAVPLLDLGADRLAVSFGRIPLEFSGAGSRGTVWRDTMAMAAAFPTAGTGFGTFSAAYPLFRSPEVRTYWTHAHNDPLEVVSEGGVPGLLCLALLLAPVFPLLLRALAGRAGALAAGIAAGLLAALLHALVDFNFHVPSNAALAAVLAGVLFSLLAPRSKEPETGAGVEGKHREANPSDPPPRLRLVTPSPAVPSAAGRDGRRTAFVLGSLALGVALAATASGVRAARAPLDAPAIARSVATAAIDSGPADPGVHAALVALRDAIGRRPLDASARAVYASLLLELAASSQERQAAAFHAARAASTAPVTVPVVETSARVLARCGETARALELTKKMFAYDPAAAATLLATLEPLLGPAAIDEAIPADPAAFKAWIDRLRGAGRGDEADRLLDRAYRRWPTHLRIRLDAASRALSRERWDELRSILPPGADLPREPAAALLFTTRGRLLAATGDPSGAKQDAEQAVLLAPNDPWIRLQAGVVLDAAGDSAAARAQWERGLFEIVPSEGNRWLRIEFLAHRARLEDRVGAPTDALRDWRAVLDLAPSHGEASRRIEELSGP